MSPIQRDTPQAEPRDANLLAAKLCPPASQFQVFRGEIHEHLRKDACAKLVLVGAPAGFGKTSLMRQYFAHLQSERVPAAWVTLDDADNDADRFSVYLRAAFRNAVGTAAASDGAAEGKTLLTETAMRISTYAGPFAIFLDDFELVRSPEVIDAVKSIIAHLSAGQRIVIGSRTQPALGFGRLRAQGQLIEIGASDLMFSVKETTEFLTEKRKLELTSADIETLQARTEGWPAGVQLASLSLMMREDHGAFIQSISGRTADIAEFLVDDVFALLSADTRDFLLRTCILSELSESLCNAVTGRRDSREILEKLERDGLFLASVGDGRGQYRYHSIFASFLREQLASDAAYDVGSLHVAAATWFSERGRRIPAVEHALAARDFDLAIRLLQTCAERVLADGRLGLLRRWFEQFPSELLEPHPELITVFAIAVPGIAFGPRMIELASSLLMPEGADLKAMGVVVPRVCFLTTQDKVAESLQLCHDALRDEPPEDGFLYASLTLFYSFNLISSNQFRKAFRYIEASKRAFSAVDSAVGVAIAEHVHGLLEIVQGRLVDGLVRLKRAHDATSVQDASSSAGSSIGVALAIALYEAGDSSGARELLDRHLESCGEPGIPDIVIAGMVTRARIAVLDGNENQAISLLATLEQMGIKSGVRRMGACAWLERSRMALLSGDLSLARAYLDQANDPKVWKPFEGFAPFASDTDSIALSQARLLIHTGRPDAPIADLRAALRDATDKGRVRLALRLKILLAYALSLTGDSRPSMRLLGEALQVAAGEGFIAPFRDEGRGVLELIERYGASVDAASAGEIPPLFLRRILGRGSAESELAELGGGVAQVSEQAGVALGLTSRESMVLGLLARGMSNQELAKQLFVSENTVKTHLAHINAKLGCRSRTQALAIARRRGVIG